MPFLLFSAKGDQAPEPAPHFSIGQRETKDIGADLLGPGQEQKQAAGAEQPSPHRSRSVRRQQPPPSGGRSPLTTMRMQVNCAKRTFIRSASLPPSPAPPL